MGVQNCILDPVINKMNVNVNIHYIFSKFNFEIESRQKKRRRCLKNLVFFQSPFFPACLQIIIKHLLIISHMIKYVTWHVPSFHLLNSFSFQFHHYISVKLFLSVLETSTSSNEDILQAQLNPDHIYTICFGTLVRINCWLLIILITPSISWL